MQPDPSAKPVPLMRLPFPKEGVTHAVFLRESLIRNIRSLCLSAVPRDFIWAGRGWLADPLVLISQMASTGFVSQCLKIPAPTTLSKYIF